MEHIIERNNLTHYYGKRLIYENLSFTVPKGRILGPVSYTHLRDSQHARSPYRRLPREDSRPKSKQRQRVSVFLFHGS